MRARLSPSRCQHCGVELHNSETRNVGHLGARYNYVRIYVHVQCYETYIRREPAFGWQKSIEKELK